MASAKSAQSALAAREQLELEEVRLRERAATVAAERDQARAALETIEREISQARVAAARAGEPVELEPLARRREQAQRTLADADAGHRALLDAAAGIPREIDRLHRERWPEFAELAEQETQAALEAMAELEATYRAAFDAWNRARAAWSTPISSLDPRKDGAPTDLRPGLSPRSVPPFPLPTPAEAFAEHPAPRPRGYVAPADRAKHGRPGRYLDLGASDEIHELDADGLRSYAERIALDRRGFTRMRRVD